MTSLREVTPPPYPHKPRSGLRPSPRLQNKYGDFFLFFIFLFLFHFFFHFFFISFLFLFYFFFISFFISIFISIFTLCDFTPEKKSEKENIFYTLQFHSRKKIGRRKYFLHFVISLTKKKSEKENIFTLCDFTPEKKSEEENIFYTLQFHSRKKIGGRKYFLHFAISLAKKYERSD